MKTPQIREDFLRDTRYPVHRIVERLRNELDPLKNYLFGSQASGTASEEDSDIDICIVVPDDSEHAFKKSVRAYKSLRDLKLPKDILVRHKSRFEERATWLNSLEREIAERGTVL
jgi:predicted nucleotidyltransferase